MTSVGRSTWLQTSELKIEATGVGFCGNVDDESRTVKESTKRVLQDVRDHGNAYSVIPTGSGSIADGRSLRFSLPRRGSNTCFIALSTASNPRPIRPLLIPSFLYGYSSLCLATSSV